MTASINWIHNLDQEPSIKDKLKSLILLGSKLVLVQQHELERIRALKMKANHVEYVKTLYQHYIIDKLPKTYLVKHNS